ncbi:MAG: ribonuclease HII [Anaerolineaceae bacterium]|nr:MAG: ribonuclease HII [Anaerolineaceae bacterium]
MTRSDDLSRLPTLEFEKRLWKDGFACIAGIDEAGRGALAGPVSAAAVILPRVPRLARTLRGVRDSKQMTPPEREAWAPRIREAALAWGVGFASAEEIDALGILRATKLAAMRALDSLSSNPDTLISNPLFPDYLLTDYLIFPEISLPQTALVKGDQRSLSVAAASVLAKTARDAWMREAETRHPGYGFAQHKGYGTQAHRSALMRLGRCEIHRKTFTIQPP